MSKSQRIVLESSMQPRKGPPQSWPVPRLISTYELSQWLGVSEGTLHWLASTRRRADSSMHYYHRWFRKRDGWRLIEAPKQQLKCVQRQILDELLCLVPISEAAHGFVAGKSPQSFVMPHSGQPACLGMDLRNFFPSIVAGRVYGLFHTLGYPASVARTLTQLCTTFTPRAVFSERVGIGSGEQLTQLYTVCHVPQGAPTSPTIANLCAFRLDGRLLGLVKSMGGRYTRYADDMLFSLPTTRQSDRQRNSRLKRLAQTVAVIAIQEGFEVHYRKTRTMYAAQRQIATGIVFNAGTNVPRPYYDRLKATLYNCVIHGLKSQNRDNDPSFLSRLRGQIAWVQQQNPRRGEKLMRLYRRINRDCT